METNKIHNGDSLEVLKTFPDESINCVMTSPPYWALRNYSVNGQLGMESTPEELCYTPIKAGCPEQGIVLDPFFGAGTTGLVALKQNKKFIGIELNKDYIKIAEARIKPYLEQKKL